MVKGKGGHGKEESDDSKVCMVGHVGSEGEG